MVNFALVSAGASASIAGSVVTNSGAPNNVIDGDDNTAWQGHATAALWALKINLGQARTISSFRVNCDAIPGSVTVQSSPDDAAYTVRQSVLFPGDTGVVSLPAPVTARYWQFLVNNAAVNSVLTMWSWELRDDAGNPWPVMPGTGVSTATVTAAQLDQRFTSWFTGTPGDHPLGLPYLTWKNDTDLKAEIDAALDVNAAGSLAGNASGALAVASSVLTIVSYLQDHGLPDIHGWINAGTATLQTASDNLTTLLNDSSAALASGFTNQDHFRGNSGGGGGVSVGPASPWTLVDEVDWQGALAWQVPADMYVLSVTDLAGRTPVDVAGVSWYPRLGWWATLDQTQVGSRRYFDFASNQLRVEGGNMPGVLLKTSPLMSGHIQAWRHA